MSKLPIFILYVSDQQRSAQFYQSVLAREPLLNVPGMTEFLLNERSKLGLMPETGIARIISPPARHPQTGNGIPRCELYLIVSDPQSALDAAITAGATFISNAEHRDWGDLVAYCMDPDGHIIAFAR